MKTTFKICIIKSDHSISLPVAIGPETAAKCDESAFLQFAREVAKVAARIEAERAQTQMNLDQIK